MPGKAFLLRMRLILCAVIASVAFIPISSYPETPGSEENAAVDRANAEIDKVYKELIAKLDDAQQKSLKEAQRAWIKWRDAEADAIARLGGAVGGSAMRVDYANAQTKLIKERTEVLRGYLKEMEKNK